MEALNADWMGLSAKQEISRHLDILQTSRGRASQKNYSTYVITLATARYLPG